MFGVVRVDELRQAQGAGHACGTATHNDNVRFHLRTVDPFEGFTENKGHRSMLETCLIKGIAMLSLVTRT